MENEKKKKIMLAIVGILVLVVGIVGLTYAYFIARGQSEDIVVTSKNLKLIFDDSTPLINATDIEPIEEDEILTKATKKTFRISKESAEDKDLYVRLDMTDLNLSDNFKDFDLKWALYKGEEKITTGTFVPTLDGSTSINMATNILLNSTTPIEYNLYIWINETGLDQERLMDGTLSGKITATGEATKTNTLASKILGENNANVKVGNYDLANDYTCEDESGNGFLYCTPKFSSGLYIQQSDNTKSEYGFPTYYYRGSVTNNYVQFGSYKQNVDVIVDTGGYEYSSMDDCASSNDWNYGLCSQKTIEKTFKLKWQILRINEDGSIRLVSADALQSSVAYDNTEPYSALYNDSNIKTIADNWYENKLKSSIDNKVVVGTYCNSDKGFNTNNATFLCNPKEKIVINTKIGIPNVDEVGIAGLPFINGYYSGFNFAQRMLTMTSNAKYNWLYYFGEMNSSYFNNTTNFNSTEGSFVPIINIKGDTIISGGTGTSSNPYIID